MKLVCELCGGTLEMRNGGAVCQSCGLTYSMDTLKQKLGKQDTLSGPQTSTAHQRPIVPSADFVNKLNLARVHLRSRNLGAAQKICDEILDVDFSNTDAWQMKVRAASARDNEAGKFFMEYYRTCKTDEQKEKAKAFAREYFLNPQNNFDAVKSANLLLSICPDVANAMLIYVIEKSIGYTRKKISDFDSAGDSDEQDRYLRNRGLNYEQSAEERYVRSIADFTRNPGSRISAKLFELCDIEITFAKKVIDSRCVESYTWMYKFCERMISFYTPIRDTCANSMKREKAEQQRERERKIAEYWEAHPEEKKDLVDARAGLQEQISKLQNQLNSNELIRKRTELRNQLAHLMNQHHALGFFEFKEKKSLKVQMSSIEMEIAQLKDQCDQLERQINNQIKDKEEKMVSINDRLSLNGVELNF